jgi:hypothetical protein
MEQTTVQQNERYNRWRELHPGDGAARSARWRLRHPGKAAAAWKKHKEEPAWQMARQIRLIRQIMNQKRRNDRAFARLMISVLTT